MSGSITRQSSALVRPGQWVLVIDLSPSGALVAGRRPLRPGARVEIHFQSGGQRAAVWALVVRCSIAAMDAERVVYHAGLNFERRAEWVREGETPSAPVVPRSAAPAIGIDVQRIPESSSLVDVIDARQTE